MFENVIGGPFFRHSVHVQYTLCQKTGPTTFPNVSNNSGSITTNLAKESPFNQHLIAGPGRSSPFTTLLCNCKHSSQKETSLGLFPSKGTAV